MSRISGTVLPYRVGSTGLYVGESTGVLTGWGYEVWQSSVVENGGGIVGYTSHTDDYVKHRHIQILINGSWVNISKV